MVENHNSDNESKPLTTETEVLAHEATADHTDLSSESTSTQPHETAHIASSEVTPHVAASAAQAADHGTVATVTAAADDDDLNYDAADFAAALANFDRDRKSTRLN